MKSRQRKPLAIRVGDLQVMTANNPWIQFGDLYHLVLTLTWPRFFALLVAAFICVNTVFGTAYWSVDGSVANARPGNFFDHFFFSIETLATVGYGTMAPANAYGHIVASIEILLGMVGIALVTGIVFARFSRPRARIAFSNRLVVRDFDGSRVLMLRLANERHNRIVEATATLSLVRNEISADGEVFARIHNLALMRAHTPVFALTWTLIHTIDETSPLYGWDSASLALASSRIIVSVTGHDETMAATVFSTGNYVSDDIAFNHRFVDVPRTTDDGQRVTDLTYFHAIEPCRAM